MNFNRTIIATLAVLALAFTSCKKEEEESYFTFMGNIEF